MIEDLLINLAKKFQSAPLREGRWRNIGHAGGVRIVSIRAPAGGAISYDRHLTTAEAFQSAPLREGRCRALAGGSPGALFQSAPLREGRWKKSRVTTPLSSVSIRAPAGGAMVFVRVCTTSAAFQSAPLREGRSAQHRRHGEKLRFQSAPLREGRLDGSADPCLIKESFNPRPCGRGDCFCVALGRDEVRFNPRPCGRGDILLPDVGISACKVFQSAPLREGRSRPSYCVDWRRVTYSDSRTCVDG